MRNLSEIERKIGEEKIDKTEKIPKKPDNKFPL